jgi:hypothetical protein
MGYIQLRLAEQGPLAFCCECPDEFLGFHRKQINFLSCEQLLGPQRGVFFIELISLRQFLRCW